MSIIQEALKKVQKHPERNDSDRRAPEPDVSKIPYDDISDKKYSVGSQKLILPVGAAILLIAVILYTLKHMPPRAKPLEASNKATVVSAKNTDAEIAKPAVEDERVDRQVRTPYIPPNISPAGPQDPVFVLNGIMFLETGSRAIINGSVVEKGDKVSGATVEAIEREKVFLRYNDEKITLKLK